MTSQLPVRVERFLEADRKYVGHLRNAERGQATLRTDLKLFARFSEFLGSMDPWKAGPEEIAAWCAYRADIGRDVRTIETELSKLNYVFEKLGKGHFSGNAGTGTRTPSPCRSSLVRQTLHGIKTLKPRAVDTKRPITLECLEAILDAQPENLFGFRNRALFSIMWAGAMRLKEVISLDLGSGSGGNGHIEIGDDGIAIILSQSKMRKYCQVPEFYGIPKRTSAPRYCPVLLLKEWLRAAMIDNGPLFPAVLNSATLKWRTKPDSVALILRNTLNGIGLPAQEYGIRSFRSGCIEWLMNEGISPDIVKGHSGHTKLSTMMGYLEGATSIESSPFMHTSWVK